VTPAERKHLRGQPPAALKAYRRGGHLALLRWRMRISQRQLGELLGVHRVTIAGWESGGVKPDPWRLQLLRELAKASDEVLQFFCDRMAVYGPIWTLTKVLHAVDEERGAH
jgi:transcriptional regulator with XRE-family HTH domain